MERAQPVAVVLLGIDFISDTNRGRVDDPHHGRENLIAIECPATQLSFHVPAHPGQPLAEAYESEEIEQIAKLAPTLMVEVLLAPLVVHSDGQDVPVLVRADPHIAPRRWNSQGENPRLDLTIGERPVAASRKLQPRPRRWRTIPGSLSLT